MPRRNASSVPAPSIAPSGIHDSEATDDSMRKTGSFVARPALSPERLLNARGSQDVAAWSPDSVASRYGGVPIRPVRGGPLVIGRAVRVDWAGDGPAGAGRHRTQPGHVPVPAGRSAGHPGPGRRRDG